MSGEPLPARAASMPRIPSLDGLRALSIFLVLALHSVQTVKASLYTGLPVLNGIGSYPLGEKLDTYQPGWILIWEDGKELLTAQPVAERYTIIPRGSFDALDQTPRHHLLLYQLVPRH
jgi:hypothetical protein